MAKLASVATGSFQVAGASGHAEQFAAVAPVHLRQVALQALKVLEAVSK